MESVSMRRKKATPAYAGDSETQGGFGDRGDRTQIGAVRANEARYPIDARQSEALVIHCADPRFQAAFRRFVIEELGIATYTSLVFGGGAQAFGKEGLAPENLGVLWEQVEFFIRAGNLRKVIIFNHADCLWYRHKNEGKPAKDIRGRQVIDLLDMARGIMGEFAGVRVHTYYAALEGGEVYFEAIGEIA